MADTASSVIENLFPKKKDGYAFEACRRTSNRFFFRKKKKKEKIKKRGKEERKRHEPKTVPFKVGIWHEYGCRSSATG